MSINSFDPFFGHKPIQSDSSTSSTSAGSSSDLVGAVNPSLQPASTSEEIKDLKDLRSSLTFPNSFSVNQTTLSNGFWATLSSYDNDGSTETVYKTISSSDGWQQTQDAAKSLQFRNNWDPMPTVSTYILSNLNLKLTSLV